MNKILFLILVPVAFGILLFSCGGAGKAAKSRNAEFFSGSFIVDGEGEARFTDCATRITMRLEPGEGYELLRRTYNEETQNPDAPALVEFTGRILHSGTAGGAMTGNPADLSVRVDSLLSVSGNGGCTNDYIVAGFYRGGWEGQVRILRLRPYYKYTIEDMTGPGTSVVSQGRWYRTSVLTLDLEDENTGRVSSYQIIPVREALTNIGGGESEIYTKEWL